MPICLIWRLAPGKEILPMYFAYTYEKEMDINTSDTIRIAMNVQSGLKEDIENAYGAYRWEIASGSSVVITSRTNEYGKTKVSMPCFRCVPE